MKMIKSIEYRKWDHYNQNKKKRKEKKERREFL
jgi:hypothetical protein